MQFLAKDFLIDPYLTHAQWDGDIIHDFSVQIWIFHAVPRKRNLVLDPHSTPTAVGVRNMTFSADLDITFNL